jgi:hypothetical protein
MKSFMLKAPQGVISKNFSGIGGGETENSDIKKENAKWMYPGMIDETSITCKRIIPHTNERAIGKKEIYTT